MGGRVLGILSLAMAAMAQTPPVGYAELPQANGWYRGEPVTFRLWQGQALVEGDILLGPADALAPPAKPEGRSSSIRAGDRVRWPGRVIPYEIDPALPEQQRILGAIEEWNSRTVIRLKPREGEADFVRFTRVPSGCSSFLGRIGGGQPINLADACTLGNTIHEIGHAVGLLHEQARNDRASFVSVRYENILRGQFSDFDRRAVTADDAGPYDYGSIMHYPQLAFNATPRDTIQTIPPGIPIGQRATLSAAEIQAVARSYDEPVREVVIDTVPTGLPVTVDGETHTAPKSFSWSPGETHTVQARDRVFTNTSTAQYRFARWSDGGDAAHSLTVTEGTAVYVANYALFLQMRTGVTPEGAGAVEISPASEDGFYPSGTLLRIRAHAAEGHRFFRWVSGTGTFLNANEQGDGANPVELSLRSATANYVASFLDRDFTIIGATRPGTVITVDGQQVYAPAHRDWTPGTVHSVAIEATRTNNDSGVRYQFQGWSNSGEQQQTFTVADPLTLTADVIRQYRVDRQVSAARLAGTAAVTPQNVVLSPQGDGWYNEDAQVEVRAQEPDGLPFINWTGDIGGRTNPQTIVVNRTALLGAYFSNVPVLTEPSVVNDASQQALDLAPGMLFTVYTPGIGGDAVTEPLPENGAYPEEVNGVAVVVEGVRAGIVRLAKGSVTALAPASLPARKTVTLAVESGGQRRSLTVPAQIAAPGIYTVDGSGRGDASGTVVPVGGTARILVTGITEGLPVFVEVAGFPAPVTSLQPEMPGRMWIDFTIPAEVPAGAKVPVIVASGGARSQVTATITIE